jgi:uncharacterized membrane protein
MQPPWILYFYRRGILKLMTQNNTTANSPDSENKQTNRPVMGAENIFERALRLTGLQSKPSFRDVNKEYDSRLSLGQRLADTIAATMGSWRFIIIQSCILLIWITLNVVGWIDRWDPYPFILLNLALSFQAAYAAPIIMMSQNRQSEKDRLSAQNDYDVNKLGELEIQAILLHLEEQDRFLLELLRRTETTSGKEELKHNHFNDVPHSTSGKPLDEQHRLYIENDLWAVVNNKLVELQLSPQEVRDLIGHCHAIINIESFQRNNLIDHTFQIDDNRIHILGILYREVFISVGADFEEPDAEDLVEVSDLLLERMKYRGIDSELIAKQAEISNLLIEKLPQNKNK